MATSGKNLSAYDFSKVPDASGMKIGIAVSEWNFDITGNLLKGAKKTLLKHGLKEHKLEIVFTPGSFELPLAAKQLAEQKKCDAVIVLGSVIQGETPHFDFVCEAVANGIIQVNLLTNKPIIFGVLTDNTHQQAIDRSGGKHGNKGIECAVAAIKMVAMAKNLNGKKADGKKSKK